MKAIKEVRLNPIVNGDEYRNIFNSVLVYKPNILLLDMQQQQWIGGDYLSIENNSLLGWQDRYLCPFANGGNAFADYQYPQTFFYISVLP
jgi:hypothetical protein